MYNPESRTHQIVIHREKPSSRVTPGRTLASPGDRVRIVSLDVDAQVWFPVPEIFEEQPGPTHIEPGCSYCFTVADQPGNYPFAVSCMRNGNREFAEGGSMPRIIIYDLQ